jgi:hypothetical protein
MARRNQIEPPAPAASPFDRVIDQHSAGEHNTPAAALAPAPEPAGRQRDRRSKRKQAGAVAEPMVAKTVKDRQKQLSLGTRYGGDRKRLWAVGAGFVCLSLLSPIAIIVSLNRPSAQQVNDLVDTRLASSGTSFPKGEAVAWAGQVTRTWGTWDEKDQSGMREALMSQFLSQGLDANAGWNGKGKQTVSFVSVNSEPRVESDTHALVDASYQTDEGVWRCVTLSVFAYKPAGFSDAAPSAFALASTPTPVACAPRTGAPALPEVKDPTIGQNDTGSAEKLTSDFFPGFFAAWAASDRATLGQYVTTDATLIGLGGAFESSPLPIISSVTLPTPMTEEGVSRSTDVTARWDATVAVTWTIPGTPTQVSASYKVELRKDGNQWFVTKEPEPLVQAPGLSGTPSGGTVKDGSATALGATTK